MTNHDDERKLRRAFARLRDDEARRAPALAELVAHDALRPRALRFAWPRLALPLAGAAAAGFVWWISARAPQDDARLARSSTPQRAARTWTADRAAPIPLGSLRSPTDALLAPPLAALPHDFSRSLIPAPRVAPVPTGERRSQAVPTRRFPT